MMPRVLVPLLAGLWTTGTGIVMREEVPPCLGKLLEDKSGDKFRCDNFHGNVGEEQQCEERYESEAGKFWQCKAIPSNSDSFNCLTRTRCDPTKEGPVVKEDAAASSDEDSLSRNLPEILCFAVLASLL